MLKQTLNLVTRVALAAYVRVRREKILRLSEREVAPFRPKSILVFSTTALGDTLLSTPAIVSLRQSFPDARITFVISNKIAPLFEDFEHVDGLVLYHGGFKRFVHTVRELRKVRPDAALLPHSNGPQDIPLAVFSGARLILKPPTQGEYRCYLSFQFSRKPQHVIEERLHLVRKIGASALTTRMALPHRYYEPANCPAPDAREGVQRVIGFQIGAANTFKMWPAENFAALADRLAESIPGLKIVITGSHGERGLAETVVAACKRAEIENTCGAYPIAELPCLIRSFDLLVSNDTGTMHLAIALGIPTLCLFGPTSADEIGPYQDLQKHRVIQRHGSNQKEIPKKKRTNDLMKLIAVGEVHSAVGAMLGCITELQTSPTADRKTLQSNTQ